MCGDILILKFRWCHCENLGLILLFASGTQIYWTIQELLYADDENDTAILLWYFGAVLGGIVAAKIVDRLLKSTIYVNIRSVQFKLSCNVYFFFLFFFVIVFSASSTLVPVC